MTARHPRPRKKRAGRGASYWFLVGATVLGIAAVLSYLVPIPGLTSPAEPILADEQPASGPEQTMDPTLARQQQLANREAELENREAQVQEKEKQVAGLLRDLTLQKADSDAVGRAAAMYAAMPPYKAGPLMESMAADTAVAILRLLDEDQAAAIIMYMDPATGAQLMSQLTRPQAPASSPTNP